MQMINNMESVSYRVCEVMNIHFFCCVDIAARAGMPAGIIKFAKEMQANSRKKSSQTIVVSANRVNREYQLK